MKLKNLLRVCLLTFMWAKIGLASDSSAPTPPNSPAGSDDENFELVEVKPPLKRPPTVVVLAPDALRQTAKEAEGSVHFPSADSAPQASPDSALQARVASPSLSNASIPSTPSLTESMLAKSATPPILPLAPAMMQKLHAKQAARRENDARRQFFKLHLDWLDILEERVKTDATLAAENLDDIAARLQAITATRVASLAHSRTLTLKTLTWEGITPLMRKLHDFTQQAHREASKAAVRRQALASQIRELGQATPVHARPVGRFDGYFGKGAVMLGFLGVSFLPALFLRVVLPAAGLGLMLGASTPKETIEQEKMQLVQRTRVECELAQVEKEFAKAHTQCTLHKGTLCLDALHLTGRKLSHSAKIDLQEDLETLQRLLNIAGVMVIEDAHARDSDDEGESDSDADEEAI